MKKHSPVILETLLALIVAFGSVDGTAYAQSEIDNFQANCDTHGIQTNKYPFKPANLYSQFLKQDKIDKYIRSSTPESHSNKALLRLSRAIFLLANGTGTPYEAEGMAAQDICGVEKYPLLTCPITSCADSLPGSLCGIVDTTTIQTRSVPRVAKLFRLYRKAIHLKMASGGSSVRGRALLKMLPEFRLGFDFEPATYAVNVVCARFD